MFGFRVWGLGFSVLGFFGVWGFGVWFWVLGFRVGLGCRRSSITAGQVVAHCAERCHLLDRHG